ncbi:MAG TPA: enoyl-CoA hydratase-related protein [Solirubrobacteraceae bacterium]|nr:enoyl-CoA hydratase-related protein [Solirubrobacteraceae bacterium]
MPVDDPEDLHRLFAERANAGDLQGLIALYEDGAAFVGPDGTDAAGSDAIQERLEGLLVMAPRITPTSSRAVMAGDIALLSNRFHMTLGPSGGERAGLEGISTEVARRQSDGSWLYVIDDPASSTVLPGASLATAGDPAAFEQLLYEEDGPIVRIQLNRPERRNALSMQLSDELMHALELVRSSESVKVLVIHGAGGTFCAGDDITEMGQWGDANQIVRRVRSYQQMADTLADLDKVTIAAVDGFAVGGGLEITMVCDFVIATRRAKWGMPEVDVGITPGWGGTTRMARLIGRRLTKEINLLGALHPASRAVELGLWNRVVDDDQLQAEVDALVEVLLSKNQQAVRQLKFIIDKGVEADLHTAQGFEALSAGLTGAVNGAWQVQDADQSSGIVSFISGGEQWQTRRALARDFWTATDE